MSPHNNILSPKIMRVEEVNDEGDITYASFIRTSNERDFVAAARRVQKLYVAAWLSGQGRNADAKKYVETGDPAFEKECGIGLRYDLMDTSIDPPRRWVTLDIPPEHDETILAAVSMALEKDLR